NLGRYIRGVFWACNGPSDSFSGDFNGFEGPKDRPGAGLSRRGPHYSPMELPLPDCPPALPEGLLLRPSLVDLAAQRVLFEALGEILRVEPPLRTRVKGGGMTSAAPWAGGVLPRA